MFYFISVSSRESKKMAVRGKRKVDTRSVSLSLSHRTEHRHYANQCKRSLKCHTHQVESTGDWAEQGLTLENTFSRLLYEISL